MNCIRHQAEENKMLFLTIFRTITITVSAFLLLIAVAVTPASAACSNTSLKGVYGYYHGHETYDGNYVVGQFTANGKGDLTGSWTWSWYGSIYTGTFTGTYSISSNCTGSLTFSNEENSPENFNIVLDDAKKAFQMIVSDSGSTQPGFGVALGHATCGLTGKTQTFATNLSGILVSSDEAEAIVGQITLNGNGNISGTETFSVNNVISTVSVTGTYTQNSDCIGAAQITPAGSAATNFYTVAVDGGQELLLIETDNNSFLTGIAQE
jgi:hypothetical protein